MGKMSQPQKILGEKPARKRQLKRPSPVFGDNIKMNIEEIRYGKWPWTRGELPMRSSEIWHGFHKRQELSLTSRAITGFSKSGVKDVVLLKHVN
jgi:hypothetical protein